MSTAVYEILEKIKQLNDEDKDLLYKLLEESKPEREAVPSSEALQTMFATEAVLRRDLSCPEEDEAWADL